MGAAGAGSRRGRRLQSSPGVRDHRRRPVRQRRAGPRRTRARVGPSAVDSARRAAARRGRGGVDPARHLGQPAGEPARGLYSPVSRHSCPGGEEQETENTKDEALTIPVEYASERKIRERNKLHYRFNHWPIWIFVFFIAPGPLTFDLFEQGFDYRMALWLAVVMAGTAIAGLRGSLPGVEPKP